MLSGQGIPGCTMPWDQCNHGTRIEEHGPHLRTGPQEPEDIQETDTWRAAILGDKEDPEWRTYPRHHGSEGAGEDDLCQYGIQPFNGCSPEKKGHHSVSHRT